MCIPPSVELYGGGLLCLLLIPRKQGEGAADDVMHLTTNRLAYGLKSVLDYKCSEEEKNFHQATSHSFPPTERLPIMAQFEFTGNLAGNTNAFKAINAIPNAFEQLPNKTVYIYTEEVDGDLAWDAALCPGGETLPEFPAMFSGITNDEEEKDFFTKAEGKFLKIEDMKYDEVENSVTFTATA